MTHNCLCGDAGCLIPLGKCHCGCGESTTVAAINDASKGWVKGQPVFYIRHHGPRREFLHQLTDIDIENHRAVCSHCGLVTISRFKRNPTGWRCLGRLKISHRLTEVDKESRTAWCLGCCAKVDIKPRAKRDIWVCIPGAQAYRKASYTRDIDKVRDYSLQKKYGITLAEYTVMLAAQGGVCWICKGPPNGGHDRFVVDHCHDSNAVRGMLCARCNRVLGMVEENPDILNALIDYLTHFYPLKNSALSVSTSLAASRAVPAVS